MEIQNILEQVKTDGYTQSNLILMLLAVFVYLMKFSGKNRFVGYRSIFHYSEENWAFAQVFSSKLLFSLSAISLVASIVLVFNQIEFNYYPIVVVGIGLTTVVLTELKLARLN